MVKPSGPAEWSTKGQELPARFRGAYIFNFYNLKRLCNYDRVGRVLSERLTEPIHLNIISLLLAMFGSFRLKVAFDLIIRQQFAFSILYSANQAAKQGIKKITLVEFGVAYGAGLINICAIAAEVTKITGIEIDVFGFDTGTGMPPAIDYRDHPELWQEGDFPIDVTKLKVALPSFAQLLIGDVGETIPEFLDRLSPDAPLAFVSLDLDYYSSSKKALEIFKSSPEKYLPMVLLYLDDITVDTANPWCGEHLAVREFNEEMKLRKIAPFAFLRAQRIFKNAKWIDQIYVTHVLDHDLRTPRIRREVNIISNEYIRL